MVDNQDGTWMAIVMNANGMILHTDAVSSFNAATGDVTFTSAGAATFRNGVISFANGNSSWTKTEETPDVVTTTTATTTTVTMSTTTIGVAINPANPPTAIEAALEGVYTDSVGNTVTVSRNSDGSFTAEFEKTIVFHNYFLENSKNFLIFTKNCNKFL